MVNLPPDPNDQQPTRGLRDKDEAIAVAIAFLAIGAILWWGWTRGQRFVGPLVEGSQVLQEPLIEDEPLIDFGGDAGEEAEERAFSPFSGREDTSDIAEVTEPERPVAEPRRRLAPVPITGNTTETETATIPEGVAPPEPELPPNEVATPPPLDISDVSEEYWAYPYIVDLFEADLLPDLPSGQLQPDRQLTRAEFAALLNSSFVQNESGQRDLNFSDISQDYWAADAIQQVVDAGYMSGYPDGTFKPDEIVPRYQVLVTLASGLNLSAPANPQEILSRYEQGTNIPEWALGQVAAAAENRLVVNYPNPQNLAPQQPATRGEIIVMMHQALLNRGEVEEIPSPYVNPQG